MARQHRTEAAHFADVQSMRDMGLTWLFLVAGAIVIAGYVGCAMLLFLPLLALRKMFPHASARVVRTDDDAPLHDPRMGNLWDAATRRAAA